MDSKDELGDYGRKAMEACFKVRTCNVAQLLQHDRTTALERVMGCYERDLPCGMLTWLPFDPFKIYDVRNGHNISALKSYDILVIREVLSDFDKVKYVEKYPNKENPRREHLTTTIDTQRDDVLKQMKEAEENPSRQRKYSRIVAERMVRNCFAGNFAGDAGLLEGKGGERYSVIDIYKAAKDIDREKKLLKYPEAKGEEFQNLKVTIEANWKELEEEYKDAKENPFEQRKYSSNEAERRVRDCFAGTLKGDTDIFPNLENSEEATVSIFDIKSAIDYFDEKMLIDKYPKPGQRDDKKKKDIDDARAGIKKEYEDTIKKNTKSSGTGFFIGNGLSVTSKRVLEEYLKDEENHRLFISNKVIGYLPASLPSRVYVDHGNDLALLCCPELELKKTEILPFHLCDTDLLVGQSVFCFGYPCNSERETPFFVKGEVAGYKEELQEDSLVTLNCSLKYGCSGGPVMRWMEGKLEVLGVVEEVDSQKVFQESEKDVMDFLQIEANCWGVPDLLKVLTAFVVLIKLVFKLNDALTLTHSPFNFINVIPAKKVNKLRQDIERNRRYVLA